MTHIYLSAHTKSLTVQDEPISMNIIREYLRQSVFPAGSNLEVEIHSYTTRRHSGFNSCGAARLEILFYEKAHSSAGSEQIILYGVAENSCSRLKPFTLTINTCWFDTTSHHPEDRYFDSIIVDRSAAPRIIPGSSLELSLWNSGTILTARCSAVLRFASACDGYTPHPALSEVPFPGLTTIPAVAEG